MLAAAALAGAAGGLILGRFIDAGHIRRAVWINAACLVATVILKAGCGDDPILVVIAATISAVLGGLYTPSLMTAVYNMAKSSPCPRPGSFARRADGIAAARLRAHCRSNQRDGGTTPATILLALPVSFSRRCSSIEAVCRRCRDLMAIAAI